MIYLRTPNPTVHRRRAEGLAGVLRVPRHAAQHARLVLAAVAGTLDANRQDAVGARPRRWLQLLTN